MKITIYLLLTFTALTLSYSACSQERTEASRTAPQGWIWGLGIAYSQDIYKDFDSRFVAFPVVGYMGEKLKVYGPFVNYELFNKNSVTVNALLTPRFAGFDDDDGSYFDGMSSRNNSLDMGFSIDYQLHKVKLNTRFLHDTLNTSNGFELSANLSRAWGMGPFLAEPVVGLRYFNSDYVNYYYGVRQDEATVDRSYYKGSATVNYNIGINLMAPVPYVQGLARLNISRNWYGQGMTDSPLTEGNSDWSVRFTFSKFF